MQATASLARLADSAGESSSPSTDSDSSSDEDSEYEIEDIYQVPLLLISSSVQYVPVTSSGSKVTWKSTLHFAGSVYLFDATHGVAKQFCRF